MIPFFLQVLVDMHELHKQAEERARHRYNDEPYLQDDIDAYKVDLKSYFTNLIYYRAHLVHKKTEASHDDKFYSEINDDEILVIIDNNDIIMNRSKLKNVYI